LIRFNVIAFTHAGIGIKELGHFHLEETAIVSKMNELKNALAIDEIMYLSTCNRIEFIFARHIPVDNNFIRDFIQAFNPKWNLEQIESHAKKARHWSGINAVNHLIEVAASIDSMVIGEREIITQVRNAFDFSRKNNLSGDTIRLVIRQTIETAKKVYTNTSISEKSVSVVSLAYQELSKKVRDKDARILIIGSGITNQNMCRFLQDEGYTNFVIFNRTLSNAQKLAQHIGGEAKSLDEIQNYTADFDLIISCTGAGKPIITSEIYGNMVSQESKKVIVDLAVPQDIDDSVMDQFPVDYISVDSLKQISDKNLLERKKELLKVRQIIYEALEDFKQIFELRQMEIKLQAIPTLVKDIRAKATTEVFSKEMNELDDDSKELLNKILNYMEKKYVSVPMIMAKQMLTK